MARAVRRYRKRTQSVVVTLDVTINADGSFTGTEDHVITANTTVLISGAPSTTTTSTYDTSLQPVSGNVNTPTVITNNSSGNNLTETVTFSSDHSQVTIAGTDALNVAGISGIINESGVFSISSPLPAPPNDSTLAALADNSYSSSPSVWPSPPFQPIYRAIEINPGITGVDREYQGVAYSNADGSQIVIAFRGTDNLQNIFTDIGSFSPFGTPIPSPDLMAMVATLPSFLPRWCTIIQMRILRSPDIRSGGQLLN